VGYVAAFATKLSDTFASELGTVYGTNTYLLAARKQVPRGTSGAVSVEGTLAGVIGGLVLTVAAVGLRLIDSGDASSVGLCVLLAATAANFVESLIGELFQEKSKRLMWLTNEAVNVINTAVGASLAMIGVAVWRGEVAPFRSI
jgi:uncharacterized protein (TIGR00297 family)